VNPTLTSTDLDGLPSRPGLRCASVCIMPYTEEVRRDFERQHGEASATIGFPHGPHDAIKVAEAQGALEDGGHEKLDMVVTSVKY